MLSYLSIGEERQVIDWCKNQYGIPKKHPSRTQAGFHDLVYMISGNWDFIIDGTVFAIRPGDVFFLPAGSTYRGNSLCSARTASYFFHIAPAEHDMLCWEEPPEDDVFRLSLPPVIPCQNNEHIPYLFNELLMLMESKRPGREKTISGMLETLFYLLSQMEFANSVNNPQLVERSLEILMEFPNQFLKEAEVAERNGVAVNTLRSAFVKHFGKTFYRYQMDNKLHMVCYYLDNHPEMKLSAIAAELGFYDEFHLSKSFKRAYGIAPYEYRKKMKE
ncbi:MAG: helix-turn-helix transcriptional regulator [Clostridia bacterium]|nr:helix-turn-helix transcriptional regulator [Clostridia bacterium]